MPNKSTTKPSSISITAESSSQPQDINQPGAFVSRLPLISIVLALLALIIYLQWPETLSKSEAKKHVVAVKMASVVRTDFAESVEGVGTARANEQVLITSKYDDIIESVHFEDGQKVRKGEILVTLNNKEEIAKVNELKANLSESEAHLKRLTELLASRATSRSIVDQQEAKTKAIEAQLVSANSKLSDLTIKAPFSGVLGFRAVSQGSYTQAGDVITSLDDLSLIKVDFNLPERLLTQIHLGQKITATNSAYVDEAFIGQISAIDSRIDSDTRSLKVRAKIDNKALKLYSGMLLKINVLLQVEKILRLPESSIIPIEDNHYVFVVNEGVAVRKQVTIGRRQPGFVEILSGLVEGEKVVVEGALKLRDGVAVNVIEDTPALSIKE